MADFRAYSDKYPFRMRSETPEIAIELSLQPWRSFGVDGVIMFSGRYFELEYVRLIFLYLHVSSSRMLIKMLITHMHYCTHRYSHTITSDGNRL